MTEKEGLKQQIIKIKNEALKSREGSVEEDFDNVISKLDNAIAEGGKKAKEDMLKELFQRHRCAFCDAHAEELGYGEICDSCKDDSGIVEEHNQRMMMVDLTIQKFLKALGGGE